MTIFPLISLSHAKISIHALILRRSEITFENPLEILGTGEVHLLIKYIFFLKSGMDSGVYYMYKLAANTMSLLIIRIPARDNKIF